MEVPVVWAHAEQFSWFHLFLDLFVYSPDPLRTLAQGDLVRGLYIVELFLTMPIEVSRAARTNTKLRIHCGYDWLTTPEGVLRIPLLAGLGQKVVDSRLLSTCIVSAPHSPIRLFMFGHSSSPVQRRGATVSGAIYLLSRPGLDYFEFLSGPGFWVSVSVASVLKENH